MKLENAITYLLKIEANLQDAHNIIDPAFMSKSMVRMSIYTGAIEEKLAEYEKDYEVKQSMLLKQFLVDLKMPVTAAEKRVKIELGESKAQIVYLTRITASAWRQIGVLQSRINHIVKFSETTNL